MFWEGNEEQQQYPILFFLGGLLTPITTLQLERRVLMPRLGFY